ncbi:MAG: LysE family translocator [Gammaproteobacteria bacterium]
MNHYLGFVGLSIAVLVFPGPSILLIVANSLQRGRVIGLFTVAGGLIAMAAQIAVAIIGLTSLVSFFDSGFDLIRWVGAAYLLYLGAQRWRGGSHGELRGRPMRDYSSVVVEGFIVALTNPGTMLFFVAFFPQFLNVAEPAGPQFMLMAVTFMVLTVIVDCGYALMADYLGHRLHEPKRKVARNRLAGGILMLAALVLALANI